MPTYDYKCENCGYAFELFQSMKDDPATTCPQCGTESLKRLIGAGAGLVFKGSGFYLTDYGRNGHGASKSAAVTATDTSSTNGSSSTETAKTESKSPSTSSDTKAA